MLDNTKNKFKQIGVKKYSIRDYPKTNSEETTYIQETKESSDRLKLEIISNTI